MKILEIKAGDRTEQVIAQCNASPLADTKKKGIELAAFFAFLRHADAMFERPYIVRHGDKPDFTLTTPKTVWGLEVTEVTTQGLKHADQLHHGTHHGISNLSEFLTENKRETRKAVLNKMQPSLVRPQSISMADAFRFWTQSVAESVMRKVIKCKGYSVRFDQFGIILIDGLSFNQNEMAERVQLIRTSLLARMRQSQVQFVYFCTHNRAEKEPGILVSQGESPDV